MRLVQIRIADQQKDDVEAALKDREGSYALFAERSESKDATVLSIPLETDEVESFLDGLRELGVDYEGYAVVSDLETVLSTDYEATAPVDTESTDERPGGMWARGRISREELQSDAQEMAAITPKYVFFTVVSAIVAGAGLLTNSGAVIVGSMVIAPLLGPAVGASVGSIVNDDNLFRTSVLAQVLGVVLAIASAGVFAFATKFTIMPTVNLVAIDEIASRINPGALSLVIALGSGAAGAFSISAGASAPLVGVMIAAALIPPAAAVGLSLAYWNEIVFFSVSVLLVVNVLSINIASLGVLWIRGYRPTHWYDQRIAKRATLQRFGTLFLVLLVVSGFLVSTSFNIRENTQFESTVDSVLTDSDVTVLSKNIEHETVLFGRDPVAVTVYVASANDGLANHLQQRIKRRTDTRVSVTVIDETADTATKIRTPK
ncbi:TIGR00341 family protein [Halocatena halophila]|uniref:TIGR00341 family protein n=1 Tax=Halocatena halophila TaxID=2814576 RepID=UPI002ED0842B